VVVVAAVEEDVVAEASDQPATKTRTKNNHCLEATETRIQNRPGTSRRPNRHPYHQLCPKFARAGYHQRPYQWTKTRFVVAADLATVAKRKVLSRNSSTSAYPRLLLPFTFMSFRKKKCNLFYDQDPMGFFPFPCMPSTNSRTLKILFSSVPLFLLSFYSVQTMRFSERQLLASVPMIRIHGHRCCPA
jgi:hypothetical protein